MSSDENDSTAGQTSDDAHGDAERLPPRESTENAFGSSSHLTHAQRVERVNAYLRETASKGIWSAIE